MICLQKDFQTLNTLTVSSKNMTSKTEKNGMPGISGYYEKKDHGGTQPKTGNI